MLLKKGDLLGSYEIIDLLSSSGGMSQVFLGRSLANKELEVAIKVHEVDDENSDVYENLLHEEVEILKSLRHPGIVHIYPLYVDGRFVYTARAHNHPGQPWYFAMEYLGRNNTLADYRQEIKICSVEWGIELFYQLLIIVDYLHRLGYAHYDLKPHNIFLRQSPHNRLRPMPVLADFGTIIKAHRGVNQPVASLRYSAPEVIYALRGDIKFSNVQPQKTDIWALGAIFFEILTGEMLINVTGGKDAITTSIIKGEFDKIAAKRDQKHPALDSLDTVLSRMVNSDPEKRPGTGTLIRAVEERILSICPPRIPAASS